MSGIIDISHYRQLADLYRRLAIADGATITENIATSTWTAKHRDGFAVVAGAMSSAEAARMYCEEVGLIPAHDDAIMAAICEVHRPYDKLPAFLEGYRAFEEHGDERCNPYANSCSAQTQAWDRGANAAMLHQRALAHLLVNPDDAIPETASPCWLAKIIHEGRCS